MTKKRLVVRARKDERCLWCWQGGYIEHGTHSGRPYYQRDPIDGGDKFYLFYHSALKAWFFGERLPAGPRVTYSVCSKGDARSPEEAVWDTTKVQELFVKDAEEGEDGRAHRLFVDPEFPHRVTSINRPGRPPISLALGEPHWIPGRRLRSGEWQLFDGVDARDLLQGKVGDCWLIAAIAAMAEFPNEIRRVFLRDGLKEGDGRYVLRLFDHEQGSMREVTVDEFVPCRPKHWWHAEAETYFAQANGNELWCLVLEKAMAKVFGSYGELNGGSCASAFRSLTGVKEQIMWDRKKPAQTWTKMTLCHDDVHRFQCPVKGAEKIASEQFFDHLRKCDEKNFLMAASIQGDGERQRSDGLVEGHCYSVAQAQDVTLGDKRHLRLVELRNPWGGDREWRGAWSDGDARWTEHPEVTRQLRPVFADDGAFWMSWEDFSGIFTSVFVCPKAMREGDDAVAHALASVDWRKYRPGHHRPKPPSRSSRPLPAEAMRSVKGPAEVVEAPEPAADGGREPAAAARQHHRWQVELQAGTWADFPEDEQRLFEAALQQGREAAKFEARGQVYELRFKERVQRNAKTGKERPVRRVAAAAKEAEEAKRAAAFREGDAVHVWSASRACWATDGLVVEVLTVARVIDGLSMPPGSLKVSYQGGKAAKWLAPKQLPGHVRKAAADAAEGAAWGPPVAPSPFRPPPRAAAGAGGAGGAAPSPPLDTDVAARPARGEAPEERGGGAVGEMKAEPAAAPRADAAGGCLGLPHHGARPLKWLDGLRAGRRATQ